jgi:hypothetical protein
MHNFSAAQDKHILKAVHIGKILLGSWRIRAQKHVIWKIQESEEDGTV